MQQRPSRQRLSSNADVTRISPNPLILLSRQDAIPAPRLPHPAPLPIITSDSGTMKISHKPAVYSPLPDP